jgi:hypothetical protein
MAIKDELFFGAYVGLVIDSDDPDDLGRVKVFIPGKNGPLYDGWNNLDTDIDFASPTSDKFPSNLLKRLKKTLPWARASMPIWGGGTGAFNEASEQQPYVIPTENAYNGMNVEGTPKFVNGKLSDLNPEVQEKVKMFFGAFPNAEITSTTGGTHSPTSLHKNRGDGGRAIDIRVRDPKTGKMLYTDSEIRSMYEWWATKGGATELGYEINKPGQPHIHVGFRTDGNRTAFNVGSTPSWWSSFEKSHESGSLASIEKNAPADNRIALDDGLNPSASFTGSYTVSNNFEGLAQDKEGLVGPGDVYNATLNYIKNNPKSIYNSKDIPRNGQRYGLNGTPESWANFWTAAASYENEFSNTKRSENSTKDDGGSYGILQVGPAQINDWANVNNNQDLARSYGLDPNKKYTIEDIEASADLALRAKLFVGDATLRSPKYGFAVGVGDKNGLGATVGKNTWERRERNEPLANGSQSGERLVIKTTNQGVNSYGSSNMSRYGGPVGSFSIPMVGAKVWVMFEGGSPQRPIYMGQVYDPSNIQSVN